MKEKILLDTNMLIYILDDKILDDKVIKITKMLYDSDKYSIVIHPNTFLEAIKIKDCKRKSIFLSKLRLYNVIDNPPKITSEFNSLAGFKNQNDEIDNEMLYVVKSNCVSYFITNDKELNKKGCKLGLSNRVLSIDGALKKFKEEKQIVIDTPVFIKKEYLYNLNIEDEFFLSLRNDYKGFDKWFEKKQREGLQAYVTKKQNNKITSFLMLKEEGKEENYLDFQKPFLPANRIKVSTFKVADTGKKIGETFIKIMIQEALEKNIEEIYVTVFEQQESLIYLLKQYGFELYTYKNTLTSEDKIVKEAIFVKSIKNKQGYPFVKVKEQGVFIIPVQSKYHKLLFEEAEKQFQISIEDIQGLNTSANAIKKAFISNSKIKTIKSGDILLFYASQDKRSITTLGIVDTIWNDFESLEEIYNIVNKRTAYRLEELKNVANNDSLVILFKHYLTFNNQITYKDLFDKKVIKGYPQSITTINKEKLKIIIKQGNSENMFEIL